ncbi:MAG: four helix bundle protein [Planctomycetota bacterium]
MAGYQDLKVWQVGVDLSVQIYRVTKDFPKEELYGLTSQIRRAGISIPSNIAEGHARKSQKELSRFLDIAKGSLAEVETQLIIARRLGYLDQAKTDELLHIADQESRMISGLLNSIKRQP